MTRTHLHLIRHGETAWNVEGRYQGQSDIPLNERGLNQARDLAQRLNHIPLNEVVSSPLSRALETGRQIARVAELPEPAVDARLMERHFGEAEGQLDEVVAREYPDPEAIPGRESNSELVNRVVAALTDIAAAHRGDHVAVVAHGAVIRQALKALVPGSKVGPIGNASVHTVLFDDDGVHAYLGDYPAGTEEQAPVH